MRAGEDGGTSSSSKDGQHLDRCREMEVKRQARPEAQQS